jgi:hypothetical protein
MIDDMTARRLSEATQKDYVRNVRNFTAFLGRSPEAKVVAAVVPSRRNKRRVIIIAPSRPDMPKKATQDAGVLKATAPYSRPASGVASRNAHDVVEPGRKTADVLRKRERP